MVGLRCWQKLKDSVGREVARVSRKELCHVPTDIFGRFEACLEARARCFETLL
jgi:hypothetical protein